MTDYENAARRAAAADVQHGEAARILDLVLARVLGHLLPGVERLAHAGRVGRVTAADEATARIDRHLAAELDHALFDRLPRLAGFREPEVVDRHVLGRREAIVRLDALEAPHVLHARAA